MEFLDDLIKNQDEQAQPEQESAPKDTSWEDLLRIAASETLDETEAEIPNPRGSSRRRGRKPRTGNAQNQRSKRRKRILFFLGMAVLLTWGIAFALVLRSNANMIILPGLFTQPRPSSETVPTEDSTAEPTQDLEEIFETGPTEEPLVEEVITTRDVAKEPTPVPTKPPVKDAPFTRFDREIQESPMLIDLYQLRGEEYITLGAYEAALSDFQYVLEKDDSRAEAYAGIGQVFFYLRRWNEAEQAFLSALERNPELSSAHFWLGHIYFYKGEYKAAAKAFDLAAEYDRSDAAAEAWLAIASAQWGDYPEVTGAVTRAMSITQDLAVVFVANSWTKLLLTPPDIDGAQGDLLYAQKLEPNSFLSLNALARFYLEYRPERLAEAELLAHYAQNWAQNDIEKALALQTLGRIYLVKDLKADAEQVFIQAMELATVDGVVVLAGLPDDFVRSRE
ncbi:MAG: tetratricopeptide repeat protein [Anaerolineae bacterium]|nr:tetratricopeptide repeat protein [Anaerolineae bacterium]